MKSVPALAVVAIACLVPVAAEARPRDGKVVVFPDRVVVVAPRGMVLVPATPVPLCPGGPLVPAVAAVPRRLTARRLALAPACTAPTIIPIPVPCGAVPAMPAAAPIIIHEPAPVVVPPAAPPPVFSAAPPAPRATVAAAPPIELLPRR